MIKKIAIFTLIFGLTTQNQGSFSDKIRMFTKSGWQVLFEKLFTVAKAEEKQDVNSDKIPYPDTLLNEKDYYINRQQLMYGQQKFRGMTRMYWQEEPTSGKLDSERCYYILKMVLEDSHGRIKDPLTYADHRLNEKIDEFHTKIIDWVVKTKSGKNSARYGQLSQSQKEIVQKIENILLSKSPHADELKKLFEPVKEELFQKKMQNIGNNEYKSCNFDLDIRDFSDKIFHLSMDFRGYKILKECIEQDYYFGLRKKSKSIEK